MKRAAACGRTQPFEMALANIPSVALDRLLLLAK
jgi:hypothetical protein